MAVRGMTLKRAQKYIADVLVHKDAIPFRRYTGKIGRHAQGKLHKACQVSSLLMRHQGVVADCVP